MARFYLTAAFILISSTLFGQNVATNFTVSDCKGNSHDLFTDLNNGKIVVIAWVMPCGSCIRPTITAFSEFQKFEVTNPGKVVFYLVDDFANTNCTTVSAWGTNNGIVNVPVFSNSTIKMTDYGSVGMPKFVVLAGSQHEVIFNQNNTLNATDLANAIKGRISTGIHETGVNSLQVTVFPNPVTTAKATIKFSQPLSESLRIEVYNILGEKVISKMIEKSAVQNASMELDLGSIENGMYYLKTYSSNKPQVLRLLINR